MRSRVLRVSMLASLVLAATATAAAGPRVVGAIPLPSVQGLPSPMPPAWIKAITPTGDAGTLAQIRIDFAKPLIPVEKIDSPDQQRLLQHFRVTPSLAGRFRFLTPRMVGFQADHALWGATRVRVTITSGLTDLSGDRLGDDLSWTFQTEPINIDLPEGGPYDLKPRLFISSNVDLDLQSLRTHFRMVPQSGGTPVPARIDRFDVSDWLDSEDLPQQRFDPTQTVPAFYRLVLPGPLAKNTTYDLTVSPGVAAVHGNLPADVQFHRSLSTYAPLEFVAVEYWGNEGGHVARFTNGDPFLRFNNAVESDSALQNISYVPGPVSTAQPMITYTDPTNRELDINPQALAPRTTYALHIAAPLEDEFGQTLGNAVDTTFHTDDFVPSLSSEEGFNVLAPDAPQVLALHGLNLPGAHYYAAYHVYKPIDLVSRAPLAGGWNDPEDALLGPPFAWRSYSIRQTLNQVTAIDPSATRILGSNSGVFSYGVAADIYENDAARTPKSLYGALELTNLGIHAQWMPAGGFVMLNHLSDGSPAAGAALEIYPLNVPVP
ncbi:MAG: alpha-2-macroglobulin family protein, partial [Candidatus Eremiobacteraeota bacterium]|nr:alpha-2-macroglobulin family protein [Candidatus Eremiobacteraeota bacterium]